MVPSIMMGLGFPSLKKMPTHSPLEVRFIGHCNSPSHKRGTLWILLFQIIFSPSSRSLVVSQGLKSYTIWFHKLLIFTNPCLCNSCVHWIEMLNSLPWKCDIHWMLMLVISSNFWGHFFFTFLTKVFHTIMIFFHTSNLRLDTYM